MLNNYLVEWEEEFEKNIDSSSELYAYEREKEFLHDLVYRITFDFKLALINADSEIYYFSDDEINQFLGYLSESDAINPKYLTSIFDLYDALKEVILNMVLFHYEKEHTISYFTNDEDIIFIEHR